MTKILFEDSIPKGHEYFADIGNVSSFPAGQLKQSHLQDVSILVVRSTTPINRSVLGEDSHIKFVTTATAGTNHLDKGFLDQANIPWGSAAGCNARAVAEWVISALLVADEQNRLDLSNATVGIVGAGNVGSMLASLLDAMHVNYKLCDPPLKKSGDKRNLCAFSDILKCDVISLHVPYTSSGDDPTENLIGQEELHQMHGHQILINACRGEVIDEQALKLRMQQSNPPVLILDVFDHEPDIDTALLPYCFLATPHIAGHTVEGKLRGTQMVYEQVCAHLEHPVTKSLDHFLAAVPPTEIMAGGIGGEKLSMACWRRLLLPIYDIREDDKHFRKSMAQSNQFAALRKTYRIRREIISCSLRLHDKLTPNTQTQLEAIGFNIECA
ncbi:4-phosphoerythronate dehydrogenase [Alteromonas sp. ASW11-130]|uniref:4-phosphoerythronate dehydrogenase n=1 Tax=Alteromonas sp. ASW11-130 TaxID=3015775 RepID=UPI002241F54C|nr:4-phosphoerythronate dehydrogenase [Alteromonas sp. ASW11-130]MCW8092582.1 4-phosphoerythronate dehydrogenase [Alteromonas sp. ASW11-130]